MESGEVERLVERAFELLADGDAEGALSVGRELERLRHSSGFEVQALAHAELDDLPEAIGVLERGVELAPEVWLLWQLLGNDYSDEGRYAEAARAYERALHCPGVDTLAVHYNIATSLTRQDRWEEALDHLDLTHLGPAPGPELRALALAQRIGCLVAVRRHDQALEEGRKEITRARLEGSLDEALAPVLGAYASALWSGRADREGAEQAAREALALDKCQSTAMWVLRQLQGRCGEQGRLYRLVLVGRWYEPLEDAGADPPGFFTTYDVVADSPGEALELARAFEPAPVQPSLAIEECEEGEARPRHRKGVCASSGYSFFRGREPGSAE